jgi:flagellar hook protein FlgE
MLSSLSSGVSGLDNFQEEMDVIGNNIANINTTGFKAGTVDFADTFSNILQAGGTTSPTIEVGTGVSIDAVDSNWSQGTINSTGVTSDLAISGNGFFEVKDPTTGDVFATRDGTFSVDPNGNLITAGGDYVQGYNKGALGNVQVTISGSTSTSPMSSYAIDSSGNVTVTQADGTNYTCGQVLLQNFQDPQMLVNQGNNLYSNLAAAGPLSAAAAPGSAGLGSIQSGALETSNVDLPTEMANLITAQRAFEANSKIITTSNEVLQTVVNMKQS